MQQLAIDQKGAFRQFRADKLYRGADNLAFLARLSSKGRHWRSKCKRHQQDLSAAFHSRSNQGNGCDRQQREVFPQAHKHYAPPQHSCALRLLCE
jgi:hypothetical protein